MQKKGLISTLLLLVFMIMPIAAYGADENEQLIQDRLKSGDVKEIGNQAEKYISKDIEEIIPGFDPDRLMNDLAIGKFEFSFQGIINGGIRYIFKEIYLNISILIKLVVVAVLCAVLRSLQTSFLNESVGEIAFFTCYCLMVSILLVGFNNAIAYGKEAIDNMVGFMNAMIPVLIALMVSSGNLVTAGTFHPMLVMAAEIAGSLMKNVLLPLIFVFTILMVISNISEKIQISKLSDFIKQIGTWLIGAILSIFVGVVTMQGAVTSSIDGISAKTTKFAINTLIPVAGKYMADAAEMVVGCTMIIKNAASVVALITILLISAVPILKVVALIMIYRFTAVLVEPVTDKRIVKCITDMSNALSYIFAVMTVVALMFLVAIAASVNATTATAAIR